MLVEIENGDYIRADMITEVSVFTDTQLEVSYVLYGVSDEDDYRMLDSEYKSFDEAKQAADALAERINKALGR